MPTPTPSFPNYNPPSSSPPHCLLYDQDPIRAIVEEFARIGLPRPMAEVLLRLERVYDLSRNSGFLRDTGALNPLETPAKLALPVNNPVYNELLYSEK